MGNYIKFEKENLSIVDINDVRENTWNPKKVKGKGYKEVVKSVENRGLLQPIMVRKNPNGESTYEILDGCHRYNACKDLGYDKILIYDFGEIDDDTAKSYTIYWETGVKPDKKLYNELLLELKDAIDLPYSMEFLDNLELQDEVSKPEPVSMDDDFVPNYCFSGLSQEDFEYISEHIDMICDEKGFTKEKDALTYLIGLHNNSKIK